MTNDKKPFCGTDRGPLATTAGAVRSTAESGPADVAGAHLGPEARDAIGNKLRQLYGTMLENPLPDRFKSLLDDLAKAEKD